MRKPHFFRRDGLWAYTLGDNAWQNKQAWRFLFARRLMFPSVPEGREGIAWSGTDEVRRLRG